MNEGNVLSNDFFERYSDNLTLARDEMNKINVILKEIEGWKEGRFEDQMYQFERKLDEDAKTALILQALEDHGVKGVLDSEVNMAMFTLIENTAVIMMHLIANEDVRL